MESEFYPIKGDARITEGEKTERERERGKSVAKEKGKRAANRRGETAKGPRIGFLILLDEERNVSQDGRRNTDK